MPVYEYKAFAPGGTTKSGIVYDVQARMLQYGEIQTTSNNAIETLQTVKMRYDALGRMIEQDRFVTEQPDTNNPLSAGFTWDKKYVALTRGITYNRFDQQLGSDQIQYDTLDLDLTTPLDLLDVHRGLNVGGVYHRWDASVEGSDPVLSVEQRYTALVGRSLADHMVSVTSQRGSTYDLAGRQQGFISFQFQAGKNPAGSPTVPYIETVQSSVRSGSNYYVIGGSAGLLSGYREVTRSSSSDLENIATTRAIQYEKGVRTTFETQTRTLGRPEAGAPTNVEPLAIPREIDLEVKSYRLEADLDARSGQLLRSVDFKNENGLGVTTISLTLAFDSKGRALKTETTVFTEGDTKKVVYFRPDNTEISAGELALLFEQFPGVSIEDLANAGQLIVNADTPHHVSERSVTTRDNIVYDNLDRQISYSEETRAPGCLLYTSDAADE